MNIPKGTKDILPSDSYKWQFVENKFRDVCNRFGFSEIRTPMFEHTELFQRGIGDTTDVVQKEMYTFTIADRSLSLKPEGTAGVVRSFIENKLYAETMPAKYYYATPCFRYEKMQKGRQREFHQFGIEIFGSESMLADAEVISLAYTFLTELGIDGLKLKLNSIGCPACRAKYREILQEFLRPNLDKFCDTCKGRFDRNPMRILDCKSPECQALCKGAPQMIDYLCDDCKSAFSELCQSLDMLGIPYEQDSSIVRGLDYYTKTAFEFVSDKLGAQATVCGGGRYDHLIEQLDGPVTPGVGFGLGIERLLLIIEAMGIEIPKPTICDIFVASLGDRATKEAIVITNNLRTKGYTVQFDVNKRGLKGQLKYADRLNANYVIIIGDDELDKGIVQFRNMSNSSQKEIAIDKILEEIQING
ncbi:MAG: histidine--tRNA ligase [Bacillota bacterium]|nr:histidine--tRNA ligase [Bacillota bacterium]